MESNIHDALYSFQNAASVTLLTASPFPCKHSVNLLLCWNHLAGALGKLASSGEWWTDGHRRHDRLWRLARCEAGRNTKFIAHPIPFGIELWYGCREMLRELSQNG